MDRAVRERYDGLCSGGPPELPLPRVGHEHPQRGPLLLGFREKEGDTAMMITKEEMDTRYAHCIRNLWHSEHDKAEIWRNFSEELGPYDWTEQDICE